MTQPPAAPGWNPHGGQPQQPPPPQGPGQPYGGPPPPGYPAPQQWGGPGGPPPGGGQKRTALLVLAALVVLAGVGVTLALVLSGGDDGDGDGGGSVAEDSGDGGEERGGGSAGGTGQVPPEVIAEDYMEAALTGDLSAATDLMCADALAALDEIDDPEAAFQEEYQDLESYDVLGSDLADGEDYVVDIRVFREGDEVEELAMIVAFEEGTYTFCGFQGSAGGTGGGPGG